MFQGSRLTTDSKGIAPSGVARYHGTLDIRMKNRRNYYRILHVQPDAPPAIVRASYRTLMQKLKLHPDLGGDELSARWLNEAYAVISDPARRASYDQEEGFGPGGQKASADHRRHDRDGRAQGPCETRRGPAKGAAAPKYASSSTGGIKPSPRTPGASTCAFCGAIQPNFRHKTIIPACTHCDSPQQAATELRLSDHQERAIWRMQREGGVSFYTRWPQTQAHRGTVTDLSLTGMGIHSTVSLEPGAVIKVNTREFQALVRVANCTRVALVGGVRGFRAGGQFLTLEFSARSGNFISVTT